MNTNIDYTPTNTGIKVELNRLVNTISVNGDIYTMPEPGIETTRYMYTDLTSIKSFTVKKNEPVIFEMTQTGNKAGWMNAFVYIDMDDNGFTASVGYNGYTPQEDLVSFSFYSNSELTDSKGKNSEGTVIEGDARSTLYLPTWNIPESLNPGEYRIRFKYDWNNINPNGESGVYFNNTFAGHGSEIIDAKLIIIDNTTPTPTPIPTDTTTPPTDTTTPPTDTTTPPMPTPDPTPIPDENVINIEVDYKNFISNNDETLESLIRTTTTYVPKYVINVNI
jgi:hypothetical protein